MKLYQDYCKTATITIPELNRRDPITNNVIETYTNIEVKIEDFSLVYKDEPTFKFTLYIPNTVLDFKSSFKFDYFINSIHVELFNCRVDSISSTTVELSCLTNLISGFDVNNNLFIQLIAPYYL